MTLRPPTSTLFPYTTLFRSIQMIKKAGTVNPVFLLDEVDKMSMDFRGEIHAHLIDRSEEHTSELQSLTNLVCRLLLEKKNNDLWLRAHIGTHYGRKASARMG